MKIADLATRIKWKPVLALIMVIIVAAFFLFGFPSIQSPLQESWKGDGDIKMRVGADPASVGLDGTSKAKVEVRNDGKESQNIKIKLAAESTDQNFIFDETGSQEVNASVNIGPMEMRELSFKVDFNASSAGVYRVKVTVSPPGENIISSIPFDVKEKK